MKNIKRIRFILLFVCLLCGCEKSVEKELPLVEENPFNTEEIENAGQEVSANYGWGVKNYDPEVREIPYSDGEIRLGLEFSNSGPNCEVGMMIFIDGIPQKYSNESSGMRSYMNPVNITEKQQEFSIYLEPKFTMKGKKHRMFIACIYEPSYRDKTAKAGFGNFHKISALLPWHIVCKKSYDEKLEVSKGNDLSEIPKSIKEEFARRNEDGQERNILDYETKIKYFQDNKMVEGFSINAARDLQIKIFGGETGEYRLSLFVDHELVNAFSGKPYVDISLKKDKMLSIDIPSLVDISSAGKGSCMYVMMCPIDEQRPDEVYELIKMDSIVLMK